MAKLVKIKVRYRVEESVLNGFNSYCRCYSVNEVFEVDEFYACELANLSVGSHREFEDSYKRSKCLQKLALLIETKENLKDRRYIPDTICSIKIVEKDDRAQYDLIVSLLSGKEKNGAKMQSGNKRIHLTSGDHEIIEINFDDDGNVVSWL